MLFGLYMTQKEAKAEGFTHHGKYFGIPVWIGDPEVDFVVATKFAPFEIVMSIFHHIEQFMGSHMYPDDPPAFQFLLGRKIE